jgi:multimeric flavodoxin WrbA
MFYLLSEFKQYLRSAYVNSFGCWVKAPGECVIDDGARSAAKKLVPSDLAVFLSPIVFGGYSYELKKVLDRQI